MPHNTVREGPDRGTDHSLKTLYIHKTKIIFTETLETCTDFAGMFYVGYPGEHQYKPHPTGKKKQHLYNVEYTIALITLLTLGQMPAEFHNSLISFTLVLVQLSPICCPWPSSSFLPPSLTSSSQSFAILTRPPSPIQQIPAATIKALCRHRVSRGARSCGGTDYTKES